MSEPNTTPSAVPTTVKSELITADVLKPLVESYPKSVRERLSRLTRIDTPTVTADIAARAKHKLKHKGNNDPTKTGRGKRAVQKTADDNAENPEKFNNG